MAPSSFQEKVTFFKQLTALEHDSDVDDDEHQIEEERRKQSRAFFVDKKKPEPVTFAQQLPLVEDVLAPPKRTASAPTPITTASHQNIIAGTPIVKSKTITSTVAQSTTVTSFVEESPVPETAVQKPRRSVTNPLPSGKALPSTEARHSPSVKPTMGKRKRNSSEKAIPEASRIFKGLSFFYIPNNDIAQARKLRINRAESYGAQWVRKVDGATHVIVDKNLAWKHVESTLPPVEELGSLVVVNEDYPLDCIGFRNLLNPDQFQYRVSGFPIAVQAAKTTPGATSNLPPSSSESLQVKARPQNDPSKWDYIPPRGTPPSSAGLSGRDRERESGKIIPESQAQENPSDEVVIPSSQHFPSHQAASQEAVEAGHGNHNRNEGSYTGQRDELSECIEMMQKNADLPFDDEDEDAISLKTAEESISDDESGLEDERARKRRRSLDGSRKSDQKDTKWEDKFVCNQGGTKDQAASDGNPNARTIEVLQQMCDHYSRTNEHWRTLAYRKVITILRGQTVKIVRAEEAQDFDGIGERLAAKIEEIVQTHRLKRLEYAKMEPKDKILMDFLKIYGVGNAQANKWVAQGFRTLEDLKHNVHLTPNQRIGIEHYDDLNTRIPRKEVEALGDYVKKASAKIDPQIELLIGGSYRRGSDSSGDIDFIVTKKATTSTSQLVPFLEELVAVLTRKGFLTATLAALHAHRSGKDDPGSKWHGCCILPRIPGGFNDTEEYRPIWRRIDILLVPETEYGAALIYFTGNDIFNRSIRLLASKKGMRLNQRGLYKEAMRGPGRIKVTQGELVEGHDEKKIFEILGVRWRAPHERWC